MVTELREFDVHNLKPAVMFKASTSTPGPDGLRSAHLQSILASAVGNSKFAEVLEAFVENLNTLSP